MMTHRPLTPSEMAQFAWDYTKHYAWLIATNSAKDLYGPTVAQITIEGHFDSDRDGPITIITGCRGVDATGTQLPHDYTTPFWKERAQDNQDNVLDEIIDLLEGSGVEPDTTYDLTAPPYRRFTALYVPTKTTPTKPKTITPSTNKRSKRYRIWVERKQKWKIIADALHTISARNKAIDLYDGRDPDWVDGEEYIEEIFPGDEDYDNLTQPVT
jgi:hypothetical protein